MRREGCRQKFPKAVALRSRAGASEACIALGRRSKSTENGLWDAGSFAGDAENQGARAMVDRIVSIAWRVGDSLILGRCFCFAGFGGQVSDRFGRRSFSQLDRMMFFSRLNQNAV